MLYQFKNTFYDKVQKISKDLQIDLSDVTSTTLCNTEENTTEHIMIYQEGNNTYNLLDKNKKDLEKIVAIYKNNKRNREKLEREKSTKGKYMQ